ncbi:aspartate aminotransferase family protein [Rhodoligotrophos defluvii]|uniref:aspartate aminotransferase family protein n=1 Tax=Rhodoligotrophos defluvii TaxID=2561934 RepID=UPI0010C95B0D|nr:aspartate aminotransferase family protein [Rhodoligotrophos defluvii]
MDLQSTNRNPDELRALDHAHHLHPFTNHKLLHQEGSTRIITHADRIWLWDADGRRMLDAMSGLWCVNVGYGRKELAEAAYRQMLELPYYNTFFKTSNVPAIALAAKIASLLPERFNKIFFVSSGSEANDTIIRLVRHYNNLRGRPQKKAFIARRNAYHGSTLATVSLGGMEPMHKQGDLPLPGFHHVLHPHWFDFGGELTPDEFGLKAAKAVEDKILELGPENVAAFIGEPIQGAAGVIIPPQTYWPEINRICKQYDVLLICDEVVCGFGRTGEWFGLDTFGIEADLVSMAKGLSSGYLPIGAVAVSDEVADFLHEHGGEFFHGYTYSGHPTTCAVAHENLRILEEEGLVDRVRRLAPYFHDRLTTLADHPIVGEVRSMGLIGACELTCNKKTRARFNPLGAVGLVCRDHCFDLGLIMRSCADTMVVAPPFVITEQEIDEMVSLARQAFDLTYRDVKHLVE